MKCIIINIVAVYVIIKIHSTELLAYDKQYIVMKTWELEISFVK